MQAISSACACPTAITTEVPGSPGSAGTAGTNGINAFSITQQSFVVPALSGAVTVIVNSNQWMSVGQTVFVAGAGSFSVTSLAGTTAITLTYLNIPANTATGNTINAGATISPSGPPTSLALPISIANGGTGQATKAAAQVAFGLGQNATFINVNGLTQTVTSTSVIIAGATVTVPAAGLYKVEAWADVSFAGVTIGTSAETITLTVNDTTASTVIATGVESVPILTTTTYPTLHWITPPLTATLPLNEVLQVQIVISQNHAGNPTAGTIKVTNAGLIITPLALS